MNNLNDLFVNAINNDVVDEHADCLNSLLNHPIDYDKKISFLSNAAERLTEEEVTYPLEEEYDNNGNLTGTKYTEEAQEVFDGHYNELEEIFNKHFNVKERREE